MLELTRYIHLNPLRVGMVRNIKSLNTYPYTGHAALMGKQIVLWQDTDKILGLFAVKKAVVRRKYRGFVSNVLARCDEKLERRFQLSDKGVGIAELSRYVAELFDLTPDQVLTTGSYPMVVRARSLLCYWAVRGLGLTATDLAKKIGMTQPAISISVKRGENIAKESGFSLKSLI